ncbi:UDP-Glycosyltransferase/glycogen phosphorylase [Lentinus brumalis]|uniref:UDP-Glycosyltransferase/glycogen phosphorylase n=1 Tax=Lentinus brumalis TaxID=2498619 RepID=A0A371DRG8_9APHY|nr:UDP-Glycosyltransferase/glycogen phosphorylase [Polyporus brumalis]
MCTLAARLVKLREVTVTLFTVPSFYDNVQAEIARDFFPGEELLASRLRAEVSFKIAWGKLLDRQPLVCAKTGAEFEPHSVLPSAAILDKSGTKAYIWFPAAVVGVGRFFKGLNTSGGGNDGAVETIEEVDAPVPPSQASILTSMKGKLVRDPFNPPMYDYEYNPQEFPYPPGFIDNVMARIPEILDKTEGIVTFDAADYAPHVANQLRAYYEKTGRKVYYAGPLIPQRQEDTSKDPRSQEVTKFLDEKLASHSEGSLIYISFGSLFWPVDNAKLWAVLDVIMERNIPFVMSCVAAWFSKPPVEMQEKIACYSHGIMADWVPQQTLLAHPMSSQATGWYISHGGHNSTLETILAGIPTILWPISGDQPANAVYLSETLDVSFELIEVRHGAGAGKIYRNGRVPVGTVDAVKAEMRDILERAYGEEGARKRANILSLGKTLQTAWSENGIARGEVEALLDAI